MVRVLPVLALVAVGCGLAMPVRESASGAPSSGRYEPQRRSSATRLYEQNCTSCHGDRGQGGGAGTRTFLTRDLFDQKYDRPFFDKIKKGLPDMGMAGFGEVLSDEEIWALVVHIRELQARHLRAAEPRPREQAGVVATRRHRYQIEKVVDAGRGLRTPWAIDWLPDGRMLVTNRPGGLFVVREGALVAVEGVPETIELGQGGMMDVAVPPNHRQTGWIYLAYTEPGGRGGMTKIVRGKLNGSRWSSQEVIFQAKPEDYTGAGVHFGCRIVFDGKGHLFFAIGDRGQMDLAQDLGRPQGKVFRLTEDGKVPRDNPFVGRAGVMEGIWSYGHRNPQGLAFGLDGALWDTEHAPRGGDEFNLIRRGANYGWPLVSFGINYNDSPFRTPWPAAGQTIAMPADRWLPSTGVCGLDVMRGSAFPQWRGDFMAGGLAGQNVDRLRVKEGKVVEREEIVQGLGRVRDVACGPDGMLYLVLNGPDRIVRLVPAR
jgi:glucose/arabinose dehydrogenase